MSSSSLSIPVVGPARGGGCPSIAAKCLCRFKEGHKGEVHRCDCGGAWKGTEPHYEIVRYPHGINPLVALWASLGGDW